MKCNKPECYRNGNLCEHPDDCPEREGSGASPCSVPRNLLEALLDNTYELRGERNWWNDEPRCNYQRDYQRYCDEIEKAEEILRQNDQ